MLKDTPATISCVVTGLTKQLDAVGWEKPNSGGAVTHGTGGYEIATGTYQDGTHSQTTILTIPAAANGADTVFSCVITSNEHTKLAHKTAVSSNVFSKYAYTFCRMYMSFKVFLSCEGIAYYNTRKSSSWVITFAWEGLMEKPPVSKF